MTWTERRWPDIQEGIIGTVFVLAATLQVLLLAGNVHAGEYLKDLLVGQILWVNYPAALRRRAADIGWCSPRGSVLGAATPRADGVLSAVRSFGHCVGADRRRVSGVFDADHSGARDTTRRSIIEPPKRTRSAQSAT